MENKKDYVEEAMGFIDAMAEKEPEDETDVMLSHLKEVMALGAAIMGMEYVNSLLKATIDAIKEVDEEEKGESNNEQS